MRRIDGTWPPPDVLKAIRAHARGRPYTRRRLTRTELHALPLSRIVEIGSADDIAVARRARWPLRPGGFASSRPSLKHLLVLSAMIDKRAGRDVRDIVARLRQLEEERERRLAIARARHMLRRKVGPVMVSQLSLARARRLAAEIGPSLHVCVRRGRREYVLPPEQLRTGDVILDWERP